MFVYISLLDGLRCRSKRKTKNGENSLVFSGKNCVSYRKGLYQ